MGIEANNPMTADQQLDAVSAFDDGCPIQLNNVIPELEKRRSLDSFYLNLAARNALVFLYSEIGRLEPQPASMAIKATIYKARLQLADIDRNLYGDYDLMIARHPSETDERMLIRLLAFALSATSSNDQGTLEFAKDMWDADEPSLWEKDLTGQLQHWIEVGQPEEKRLMRASSRAARVIVYSFSSSTSQWWNNIGSKVQRLGNLNVWQVPSMQSQALAMLANRSMKLDVTVQDGTIWVGDGRHSIEVSLHRLFGESK